MMDISQKKYYEILFHKHPWPLWIYDPETLAFLDVNKVACEAYGYTREEFLQLTLKDIRPPEDIPILLDNIKKIGHEPIVGEVWRHQTKDGKIIFVDLSAQSVMYANRPARLIVSRDVTDLHNAQQSVRESEKQYRQLVEMAPFAIMVLSEEQVVFSNQQGIKMLGAESQEQILGQPFLQFVHPDSMPDVLSRLKLIEYSEPGEILPFAERKIRKLDGTSFIANTSAQSIQFNGKPAIQAVLQDITEQKQLETEKLNRLSTTYRRQAALVELSNYVAITLGDLTLSLQKITEVAAVELSVERVSVWLFEDNSTRLRCLDLYENLDDRHSAGSVLNAFNYPKYFAALVNERVIGTEFIREDPRTCEFGDDYLLPDNIVSLLDASIRLSGQVMGVLCHEQLNSPRNWSPEDISFAGELADQVAKSILNYEQRKAEEALRASEERYRDLFENANDIIYTRDIAGRFTSINKMGQQLFGGSLEKILGSSITEYVTSEDLPGVNNWLSTIEPSKFTNEPQEVHVKTHDGNLAILEIKKRLIYENGIPVAVQGIARDITKRRMLEDQLRQAQKMEAIGNLAGGIAHDFNNLLTIIITYSDLILRKNKDLDSLRKFSKRILEAGQKAAWLTSQLLAFSRKQVVQPRKVNLTEVVSETLELLERVLNENIHLNVTLQSPIDSIYIDPGQLQQIIMNLIVNSRDALPLGGNIFISTEQRFMENNITFPINTGDYAVLTVQDTGEGIPLDVQARIFEPFFTTKEKDRGTGLGLSTVYGIVAQANGHINLVSESGVGTTFEVFLPIMKGDSEDIYSDNEIDIPDFKQDGRILVMDDNIAISQLVKEILQPFGYKIVDVHSAEEVLSLCESNKEQFDLLILDVIMPTMTGPEIGNKIRSYNERIPILYISGYGHDVLPSHIAETSGQEDFLQKPFSPEQLLKKVYALFNFDTR